MRAGRRFLGGFSSARFDLSLRTPAARLNSLTCEDVINAWPLERLLDFFDKS